ncbi:MAG: metallophosphoesterase [Planctomycetes bacterium]|nr:metallophosphoesterase [Planctomycetota bacterium]
MPAFCQTDAVKKEEVDLKKEPWKEPLAEGLYVKPYLQNVTQRSIAVLWETKTPVIGHVDYGLDPAFGNPSATASESAPATLHEILLDGLSPGTRYRYRVRYGHVTLEASTFKTAPPDGVRSCRIIAYGDARSDPKIHRQNAELMLKHDPDLILHTGDLVAAGSTYDLWQPQHFWPTQIIGDQVVIFPALGNHEQNAANHFNYMALPGNEVFFSFDYANVHIIALDSNAGWTPHGKGSPQYEWLSQDLEAKRSADWTIVYFHHPLFRCHPTRGIESQRWDWHPLFEKHGVDLVLSGHDHYYFRAYPIGKVGLKPSRGVLYLTTGGGGAPLYPVRERSYGAVAKSVHHIVVLDVRSDRIEGKAIESDGSLLDTFTVTRAPAPISEYVSYEIFEIERELRAKIAELKPITIQKAGERVAVDATLSIPTSFNIRIEGEIAWEKSDKWKFSAAKTPFVLNPGATLSIPVKAEAAFPDLYPLPRLSINFNKLINRKEGFRNDRLAFQPIRLKPLLPIAIPRIYTGVQVNGKMDDPAWVVAARLGDFVAWQGDARPVQKFFAMLAHDGRFLYALAQAEADPKLTGSVLFTASARFQGLLDSEEVPDELHQAFKTSGISLSTQLAVSVRKKGQAWKLSDRISARGYAIKKEGDQLSVAAEDGAFDRDNQNVIGQDEHIALVLSDGTNAYVFALNAQGTQYDAKEADKAWNLDWLSSAIATENGWAAELAIPIAAFGKSLAEKEWRLGLSRGDKLKAEIAALCPTLTMTSQENRLPEYSYTPTDAGSLSPVTFEGVKP